MAENPQVSVSSHDCRVLEQAGIGPDGVTYAAVQEDGTPVEIRVLNGVPRDSNRHAYLISRLRLAALIEHPAAQTIMVVEMTDPVAVVLEPTGASSLSTWWNRVDLIQRLASLLSVAEALAGAHRLGFAHGALDADTIRCRDDDTIQVDFTGILTRFKHGDIADATDRVLRIGDFNGQAATPESDLRQFARLLFEACSDDVLETLSDCDWGSALSILETVADAKSVRRLVDWVTDAVSADSTVTSASLVRILRPIVEPRSNTLSTASDRAGPHAETQPVVPGWDVPTMERGAVLATPSSGGLPRGAPSQIGRYHLKEKIGVGGMGTVYRAEDLASGERVAIKILTPSAFEDPRARRRFLKEARLLGKISSPYVVRLLEQNDDSGVLFIALELVEGVSLKEYLLWNAPLEEQDALRIAADIARGLMSAHELEIIHRDIKPGNVLLAGSFHEASQTDSAMDETCDKVDFDARPTENSFTAVKVTDFGLARQLEQSDSMLVTQTNATLGTPVYMSPEQCGAGPVTPATDVYSLGVTLYEMLTGAPPFLGDTMDVIAKHRFEPVPSLKKQRHDLSDATLRVVARCLAKDPADRFLDAAHLLDEIEHIRRGQTTDIKVHPILPDHDEQKLFRADFRWQLKSSPDKLWPFVSNTERLNNAVGVPSVEYETERDEMLGIRKFGTFQLAGMKIRWEEHPFEWVEGQRLAVLRTFSQGPFRWFLSIVETEAAAGGGTQLKHSVRIDPRGWFGRVVANLEVNIKGKPALDRVYSRIDKVAGGVIEPATRPDHYLPPNRVKKSVGQRLSERIGRLAEQGVEAGVLACLSDVLAHAPPQELARIRPKPLAAANGLDLEALLEGCLLGVREGLLELHWDVLCPTCRVSSSIKQSLRDIRAHDHCEFCDVEFEVDYGKSIELIFRAHRMIRDVDAKTYCIGGPEHAPHVVAQLRLAPAERLEVRTRLEDGYYVWRGPQLAYTVPVHVRPGGLSRAELVLSPQRSAALPAVILRGGTQMMAMTNETPNPLLVRLERTVHRDDIVTAAEVSCLPLFQELFPSETLSSGELVRLGSAVFVAACWADVAGICADLGDAAAYELFATARSTFREVVRRQHGKVMRHTAGEAFAAFDDPVAAVIAGRELRAETAEAFMADRIRPQIGIHSGAALIATSDDGTDFFGHAVQEAIGLARNTEPGTMALSECVATNPDVALLLSKETGRVEITVDASKHLRIHIVR